MALIWIPDFCPPGSPCEIEVLDDWSGPVAYRKMCAHHASLKAGGLTDAQVFDATVQSSRVKEAARSVVKEQLALDKEHPGVSYTVDASGNFTIQSGAVGQTRTAIRNAVAAELLTLRRPTGTSTVTVA